MIPADSAVSGHSFGLRRSGSEVLIWPPCKTRGCEKKIGLTEEYLIEDLTRLLRDGRLIRGPDVYRYIIRCIWWAYPLYVLVSVPVLRSLFNSDYHTLAQNRYRFSVACGLQRRNS